MTGKGISRRQFLQRTAAGIALPTIITGNALGAPGVAPAGERILIGCIGVGNQGRGNMGKFLKGNTQVVAVCEVDKTRLAEAKARVEKEGGGPCEAYSDYRKLLENKDIDAVVITVPDHWHALMSIHAMEAGKDVYCEKPLTLTILEGRAMTRAARKLGRILQTGSQQRSDDKFRLGCELVRSGRLGKIHTVKVGISGVNFSEPTLPDGEPPAELDYDMWLGPAPYRPYNKNRVHYNFRFFWDYSGGQMTNWGAHHLDIAQWGQGMDESGPVSVEVQRVEFDKQKRFEVQTACRLVYKYANGVTLILGQGEKGIPGGTTFEGEKGTIFVNRGKLESTPPEIIQEPLGAGDVHLYASRNHHGNWIECIKSRNLPICDVEIGHRSATVCHLGSIAIRTGKTVNWDPAKEQIVGDAELAKLVSKPYRAPWVLPYV